MMRLYLKPVKLKHQRPIGDQYGSLELHENYLKYNLDFEAEEPKDKDDLSLGWETVITKVELICLMKSISGIEKSWSVINRKWMVVIMVDGFIDDIKAFFNREDEAENYFGHLIMWLGLK